AGSLELVNLGFKFESCLSSVGQSLQPQLFPPPNGPTVFSCGPLTDQKTAVSRFVLRNLEVKKQQLKKPRPGPRWKCGYRDSFLRM
ncbi:hypothetical protein LEMLEM_LOCUS12805, partial [Lemmus lemmus]